MTETANDRVRYWEIDDEFDRSPVRRVCLLNETMSADLKCGGVVGKIDTHEHSGNTCAALLDVEIAKHAKKCGVCARKLKALGKKVSDE